MQSPKEVIENIRKTRFGIGLNVNSIPEDVKAHIEDNKKFKEDAARLASDLHTEKPHFILELIQNAEDNDYDKDVKPLVKFIKQEDKLILQNNEKGFNEENVQALCGIGKSTKQNKKLGYIGEKGIGFKSVFMVTNNPSIYSNGYQFEFKYDEKDPLSIIIPNWVNNIPDFIDPKQTNIVLPLKDEVKEEINKFLEIDPNLLLFLRKLRCIEIEDKVQSKSWKIERHDSEGKVTIVHPGGEDYWKIVKSPVLKVPGYIKEEKRKDIAETQMVLAFPLKQDGSADTSKEQKVFVYLPVRSYGFKFIIQADFLMPPTREDIHKYESDKSWNKWLRDNIASIFLSAVEEFKHDETLKKTYYNYIPLPNEITDKFFSPVVEQILNNLHESECILTESNNWQKPRDVFRADNEIRALIPNNDLKSFFNKEYISSDIKASKQILDALKVPEFGVEQLVQCLQKEEWLKKQSDEWFTWLYAYLNSRKLEVKQIEELKKLKIVRLENDELASTIEKPIFFPLDKKGDYGFEKELRILKRAIFEPKEKETNEAVIEFLKKMGIQNASPYEIIERHILPIYESDEWKKKDSNTLRGYIRYIKDNIEAYEKESDKRINTNKGPWETKKDPLRRLKESLYIRINKTVNSTNYKPPQEVYLPKIYGNENDLETLFEGIDDISFVHREYIDDIIKKYRQAKRKNKKNKVEIKKKREKEIRELREFFVKLGVNIIPKVNVEEENRKHTTYWGSKYERKVTVYSSPHICSVIEINSAEKDEKLAKILDRNWEHYKNFTHWEDCYFRYSWKWETTEADWFARIKADNWLPTTRGAFAKPSEVFLDKPEIRQLLGDSVLYLAVDIKNEEFIKALGINSEANAKGVLNYLQTLSAMNCKDKDIFTKLYNFLNKKFEGNEDTIKTAFLEHKIIYIPETRQIYFTSKEVIWKDVSDIFGENRGYLEKHYPNLKSFFVDKLGISEKPTPKDYADVLMELSKKEIIGNNDEKIILKIYSELNSHLDPEKNEHLISGEDWWQDFVSKPIFWTDKGFWKNNGNVFVNNNPEFYNLFKNNPEIAFLRVPNNYYPKIHHFLDAANILSLTRVVEARLERYEGEKIEQNLTKRIQMFAEYILRYLYHLEYDIYERLKKDGTFTQLKNLSVYSVDNLLVEYILNNRKSVITQRNAILYNGNLYIQKDYLVDTDCLAVEFSKLFGEVRGLDNFLISLFYKKSEDEIENLMKLKGIQELPDDEKEWFGVVEMGGKIIERKEGMESIAAKRPPTPSIETPTISTPSEITKGPESSIEERIEKKGWEPECEPEEAEIHFEEFPVLEKAEYETQEREKKLITRPSSHSESRKEIIRDTLTEEAKKEIGKWGEEYALKYLRDKFSKKYPEGKVKETEDDFIIICDDQKLVEVQWLNKKEDKGESYDIKVIENGNEKYIEVKSTKTDSKEWFDISNKQWEFMQKMEDKFHIYRIYNAGTKEAKLVDIPNPKKLWQEGDLIAYPIRIQI